MEASVRDYLDENRLEDMAAVAKKYDVSKLSIQRYRSSCNELMPNVLLTYDYFFADTLQLIENWGL